jgi:hypothetical protein
LNLGCLGVHCHTVFTKARYSRHYCHNGVNTNKSGCGIQYKLIRKPYKFFVKKIEISQEEKKQFLIGLRFVCFDISKFGLVKFLIILFRRNIISLVLTSPNSAFRQEMLKFLMFCFINFLMIFFPGKGDLVGCDISKHLAASSSSGSCPEVIVKSSCDVRALTYCDLKCLNIPGRNLKTSISDFYFKTIFLHNNFIRWKKNNSMILILRY